MKNGKGFSKYLVSVLLFLVFEAVAVTLWLTKNNLFYLLNFSYIGCCLALGTALFAAGKRYARRLVQLAVGSYMLLYLGVISRENMQIEGFWYYLFLGVFEAATIHYAVAKIFGPLLFGRGWCGYACWTAMVLDFLPYKQPQKPRKEKLGILRYIMFTLSLALVSGLFLMKIANLEEIMFWMFLIGNALYYIAGIALAFIFKDSGRRHRNGRRDQAKNVRQIFPSGQVEEHPRQRTRACDRKKIAELLELKITVNSKVEEGTRFTIEIPSTKHL